MSRMSDMLDNAAYMQDFKPLSDGEMAAVKMVVKIFREQDLIPCTSCHYCMAECPKQIAIPELFSLMNAKKKFGNWNTDYYYDNINTQGGRKASDCLKCGKCEKVCPQHLEIRNLLSQVAAEFEQIH